MVDVFADECRLAGYGHILSPIFEDLGVFLRVGESTDVVTKEMYDFEDKDGRRIALRPELTASVVRAFVQHNPPNLPWKAWYEGPQFRYEQPQAGRYRQFAQVGIETLGTDDPKPTSTQSPSAGTSCVARPTRDHLAAEQPRRPDLLTAYMEALGTWPLDNAAVVAAAKSCRPQPCVLDSKGRRCSDHLVCAADGRFPHRRDP